MHRNRCAAKCSCHALLSRRTFLGAAAGAAGTSLLAGCGQAALRQPILPIRLNGPASKCVPTVKAAFVRRRGEYGMRWPGQVYDGKAARKMYTEKIVRAAKALNMKLDLRPEPIYSHAEAGAWVAKAVAAKPDGLLVVLLDRQEHAWPTANKAIDSGIPTVIFSPVGSSFTTNTAKPSAKTGCVIYSTDDFRQVAYGLKMLGARAKMRATRCLVLKGKSRRDTQLGDLGIKLRYLPARKFLDVYNATSETSEVLAIADEYLRGARKVVGATRQDAINGARAYITARKLLQAEQADAITMDCLGALGKSKVSLPCLAWSRMNDEGVPAACEADLGAVATHTIVQYLFDRPGFQQDPVAETARRAIIGAHCTCATRLNGFDQPAEPFDLRHHHGERDAVPRTLWRIGQAVTSADVLPGAKRKPTKMIISSGRVLENVNVPPAGGCVVSVMVKFDGVENVLAYPGFHQIFFYGNYKQKLVEFCRLCRIEPVVV